MEAIRKGAPADLIFQSIAGSEKGNEAFGFTAATIEETKTNLHLKKETATGPNVMYFRNWSRFRTFFRCTYHGAEQVTMEARCYGFAKRFQPFLVNTVVGFHRT